MDAVDKTAQAKSKKPSLFSKIGKFFREVRAELKRVQWPSRRETMVYTGVVAVVVVVVTIYLGLVDLGISTVINKIISFGA
jgi:preprotein translocase, SecE subunit, bacterial